MKESGKYKIEKLRGWTRGRCSHTPLANKAGLWGIVFGCMCQGAPGINLQSALLLMPPERPRAFTAFLRCQIVNIEFDGMIKRSIMS